MKILGVDPGLNITGYGLIEVRTSSKIKLIEAGVIRTSAKISISERLKKIYNSIGAIVQEFTVRKKIQCAFGSHRFR